MRPWVLALLCCAGSATALRFRGARALALRGGGDDAWDELDAHVASLPHLRDLVAVGDRCAAFRAEACGVLLDYSRQRATAETMGRLFSLARAAGVERKRDAMLRGDKINSSEGRAVLHAATRAADPPAAVRAEIIGARDSALAFAAAVRSGAVRGSTGEALTTFVCLGIGGSSLGPETAYEALRSAPACAAAARGRTLSFAANVDPVAMARALDDADPARTLFVVVSKTFTTAETMANYAIAEGWLTKAGLTVDDHVVAVTANGVEASRRGVKRTFFLGDYVGGRFSLTSPVGLLPLALQFGPEAARDVLRGAALMDDHFLTAPLEENLPVLLGLLGVANGRSYPCRAVVPYAEALKRFPAYLQQLEMESNGKGVDVGGRPLPSPSGEVVFGEPGTSAQHSFFQMLHQGRIVPVEFLGFLEPQVGPRSSHDALFCHFLAQQDALARGTFGASSERACPGNRPSLALTFPRLDAHEFGKLVALYEHRVAVAGFLYDVNSFDQFGVELGKQLCADVAAALATGRDEELPPGTAYALRRYRSSKGHGIAALAEGG